MNISRRCCTRTGKRQGPPERYAVPTGYWRGSGTNGLSLTVVENALVLAASRRLIRSPQAPPLGTIRSLAYFTSVIEEVLSSPVSPGYFEHLRNRIQRFLATGR